MPSTGHPAWGSDEACGKIGAWLSLGLLVCIRAEPFLDVEDFVGDTLGQPPVLTPKFADHAAGLHSPASGSVMRFIQCNEQNAVPKLFRLTFNSPV